MTISPGGWPCAIPPLDIADARDAAKRERAARIPAAIAGGQLPSCPSCGGDMRTIPRDGRTWCPQGCVKR